MRSRITVLAVLTFVGACADERGRVPSVDGGSDATVVDADFDAQRADVLVHEDMSSPGNDAFVELDAGPVDLGVDAELADLGNDAGRDAGFDAGYDASYDAGHDAGFDAGYDAGSDAGYDAGAPLGLHQSNYLKASNTAVDAEFGFGLAFSSDGSTLAVSAVLEDSIGNNSGAVYIFVQHEGVWSQQAFLKASNAEEGPGHGDMFGFSIELSGDGDTLVVGALGEDSGSAGVGADASNNLKTDSGAAYVFERSGATWSQTAYIKGSYVDASDQFGYSVAISEDGNTIAVGAWGDDSATAGTTGNGADNTLGNAGSVHVYTRSASSWALQSYIKASNAGEADEFGVSVALSSDGNTLAVGADGESSAFGGVDANQLDNSRFGAGAAYVFTRSGVSWTQQVFIKSAYPDEVDLCGHEIALSLDGDTLAMGCYGEDSAGRGINSAWGADDSATSAGAVYVYRRAAGAWTQSAYIKSSNSDAGDFFSLAGIAFNRDGTRLLIGAQHERSAAIGIDADATDNSAVSAGAAYLFRRSDATWIEEHYVKASNTEMNDGFGYNAAIAADADIFAISAVFEDSSATGIDGDQSSNGTMGSGAVYLFRE